MRTTRIVSVPLELRYFDGIPENFQGYVDFGGRRNFESYFSEICKYPGKCFLVDGEIVGAAGVVIQHKGCGEGWAIMLPPAKKHVRDFQRAVLYGFERIIRDYELHRIECNVVSTFKAGIRWALSLGFKPESIRRMAGPHKEDMVLLAKFP